jgi:uncharacterized C2H2 Zn-finger protein
MGNIVLKVKDSSAQLKAYKCPYVGCDKVFFNKSDLYKHLNMDHGEMIDKTKPKLKFSKTFNTEDITQIQIMINRQRLKKYAMLIGELFEPKKPNLNKSIKKQEAKKEQKPQEETKEKPKKRSIFAIIIEILKKNRDRNAGRDAKA